LKITVLGAGAWGTTLARHLVHNSHNVTLWAHRSESLAQLSETRQHKALPGVEMPEKLVLEPDLERAMEGADVVVLSVPSKTFRSNCTGISRFAGIAVSTSKGIEFDTGSTPCEIIAQTMPAAIPAALSGPTLALEMARGEPTACVAAAQDEATARRVQQIFHSPAFRVYTSTDLRGVELGGALKNPLAIAAGTCEGLGLGDNAKAALITRALAEMRRLGVACGALPETFGGLSGLGDLTVTCFSKLSRNRTFGEKLGRGANVEQLIAESQSVVEGYPTVRAAWQLAKKLGVATPIIDEIHAVLYQSKNPRFAVLDLLTRESKAED
jgi:glycerol-3-phosphate dehydrogenase (NAD(P)+)